MRPEQRDLRAELIARKDAALARWPQKAGDAFEAEMAAVGHELARLARALDAADSEPIERLRTWAAAGEAYLHLGAHYALQYATEAFRYAENAAARVEADARELMQLKHQFGIALLKLAADTNAELAAEAAMRLSTALSLARKYMPVGVASIKLELFRAEHTVATLRPSPHSLKRVETDWRETEAA